MTPGPFDPAGGSYGRAVRRGATITAGAQVIVAASQMISVIVLARLLSPREFGLVAMAWPVISLLSLFQDFGLTQASIQKPNLTARDVNFLFWLNMAISAAVAGVVVAIAPLVASFYGEPVVAELLMAMSVLILVQGAAAQQSAIMTRRMEFDRLAVMQVAGAVASVAVSVVWAIQSPSVWALWGGSVAAVTIPTVLAWIFSGWLPGLPRGTEGAGRLLNFGAGLTGFSLANFVARNGDTVLIGRVLGEVPLGLYDRAYKLLLYPLRQVTQPLGKVMVPTLSRLQNEPERYRAAYLNTHALLGLGVLPGIAAMIVVAHEFVPFLLGEEWRATATVFAALGFAGLLQPLNNPAGWLFISQGRTNEFMVWGVVTAVTCVIAFAAGLPFGILGVAIAYAISEYLRTPFLWLYIGRRGPVQARHVLATSGPAILGAHLAVLVLWPVPDLLDLHPLVLAPVVAGLAYLITGTTFIAFPSSRRVLVRGRDMLPPALLRRVGVTPSTPV